MKLDEKKEEEAVKEPSMDFEDEDEYVPKDEPQKEEVVKPKEKSKEDVKEP